jgi:hypothetical protein
MSYGLFVLTTLKKLSLLLRCPYIYLCLCMYVYMYVGLYKLSVWLELYQCIMKERSLIFLNTRVHNSCSRTFAVVFRVCIHTYVPCRMLLNNSSFGKWKNGSVCT